jgi:sulfite reductase alpha subunit-like flavoprotein
LKVKLDQRFALINNPNTVKKGTVKHPFNTPCTVREALEYFVDLRGPIMKKTLKDLSEYCVEPEEKAKLAMLGESKEEFFN